MPRGFADGGLVGEQHPHECGVLPGTAGCGALAPTRQRKRGFNQASILAREIARATGAGERPRLLTRVRATAAQATLNAEQRATNLVGAFAVRGVPPPGVLVVNNVTTTGSTLDVIATVLKAAGAERVYALAVARED